MVGSSFLAICVAFWGKKNLTEINHKVSLIAKGFGCEIAAVFAAKCAQARKTPPRDPLISEGD
jgi:hypothetical protein